MGDLTQKRVYYGINLEHHDYSWGGVTYNELLMTEFPNSNLEYTELTQDTSISFLYETLIQNVFHIDGIADGHFTLYNSHASGTATVTAFTATLKKTEDAPSSESTLGSVTETISTKNTIAPGAYLTLPINIPISHEEVGSDEKLILYIEYTSTGGTVNFSHANDSSDVDVRIRIPYG